MSILLFHETQHMIGSAILVALIIPLLIFIVYRFRPRPFPLPLLTRVLSVAGIIVGAIIIVILATLRLDTFYYSDRIEYQFISLFSAKYEVTKMMNVRRATVIVYNPSDYGGWGMKGNATTRVYNASGDKGLLLNMHTGKNLLIGTQQPDSLYAHVKDHYPFATP